MRLFLLTQRRQLCTTYNSSNAEIKGRCFWKIETFNKNYKVQRINFLIAKSFNNITLLRNVAIGPPLASVCNPTTIRESALTNARACNDPACSSLHAPP